MRVKPKPQYQNNWEIFSSELTSLINSNIKQNILKNTINYSSVYIVVKNIDVKNCMQKF